MKLKNDSKYINRFRPEKKPEEWLEYGHSQAHVSLSSMDGTNIKAVNYIPQLPEGDTPDLEEVWARGYYCRNARLVAPADFKLPLISWDEFRGYCSVDKEVKETGDNGSGDLGAVAGDFSVKLTSSENDSNNSVHFTKENINSIGDGHYKNGYDELL